jgi:hypothetical protein
MPIMATPSRFEAQLRMTTSGKSGRSGTAVKEAASDPIETLIVGLKGN